MKQVPFVCLYTSYLDALEPFSDAEKGRLVYAMLVYAVRGEKPEFKGNERFLWPSLFSQEQRDIDTYEKRCTASKKNGSKGGRPRKNEKPEKTQGLLKKPKKAKENEKENENENENEKENENENEKENVKETENGNESGNKTEAGASDRIPPNRKAISEFCQQQGIHINEERFLNYYTANGWMVGKNPMQSWKAAVRMWEERTNGRNEIPAGDPEEYWERKFEGCQV